jgi:hypothetical protein
MKNKTTKFLFTAVALSVGLLSATTTNASLVSALGGQVVNDTDRNITWLANANLADTQDFGVSGIDANGQMTWNTAGLWIAAMNTANYLGYNDWRLPTVTDTGTSGCNLAFSGTDCGYNVDTSTGELAHLFYDELGNKGYYNALGIGPQSGWGLTNTGPFSNFQSNTYWLDTVYAPNTDYAWYFYMDLGYQGAGSQGLDLFTLAVRPGQVADVPEPETTWLLSLGLLGMVGVVRRRFVLW